MKNKMKANKVEESLRKELLTVSAKYMQLDQLTHSSNIKLQCVPEHKTENLITTK